MGLAKPSLHGSRRLFWEAAHSGRAFGRGDFSSSHQTSENMGMKKQKRQNHAQMQHKPLRVNPQTANKPPNTNKPLNTNPTPNHHPLLTSIWGTRTPGSPGWTCPAVLCFPLGFMFRARTPFSHSKPVTVPPHSLAPSLPRQTCLPLTHITAR